MAAQDYKFEGWLGHDASAAEGKMKWAEFSPKTWEETDIDIKVTHCGICGSDMHTLRSGWVCIYFVFCEMTIADVPMIGANQLPRLRRPRDCRNRCPRGLQG